VRRIVDEREKKKKICIHKRKEWKRPGKGKESEEEEAVFQRMKDLNDEMLNEGWNDDEVEPRRER
jgi:hypothetical protein